MDIPGVFAAVEALKVRPRGYLVFTTHDGDELDATFIPEDQTEVLDIIRAVHDTESMESAVGAFNEWTDQYWDSETDTLLVTQWKTQTYCNESWPFNDMEIVGTLYLLVY